MRQKRLSRLTIVERLSHRAIVEMLGGTEPLALALGIRKSNTVAHWKKPHRGIPPLYWAPIVRLAQREGFDITIADIERTSPRPSVRSRSAA